MKIRNLFLSCLLALTLTTALAEQPDKPAAAAAVRTLTKFNLDFQGGTPKELVAAIQKATGKPLNVIIREEDAKTMLPPLKMNNVDAAQLFQAVEQASTTTEAYVTATYYGGGLGGPSNSWTTGRTGYGFSTTGAPSDDSIWYFHVEKLAGPPLKPAKTCRFYQLGPYLERGLTVDDITTAIQTGWKMLGDSTSTPSISFHKETKLLIAVGEPGKLEVIDAVLKALEAPKPKPVIDPTTGLPVRAEKQPKGQD